MKRLGWESERSTDGRLESGERKEAVRDVRCRDLHFRCSCTMSLEILVWELLLSLKGVHKSEKNKWISVFWEKNEFEFFRKRQLPDVNLLESDEFGCVESTIAASALPTEVQER